MTPSSAHFISNALAATSCSVVVTDATQPDFPITYANAAFSALSGYAVAEVIGRNCRFLQGPDTDPHVSSDIRAAITTGHGIHREILNYRKDGTSFWNELTIDPIRDAAGRLTGFIGIQRQADAARLATEARAEAEAKLDSIVGHIPGFIYRRVMRTDGTIDVEYCSPFLGKMLGTEDPDLARHLFDYVHPDDHDALIAAIRSSAANLSVFREEFRLVSTSGTVHWLRSDAPPRRMKNGEILWDGLAIEISAEKRWQSEIANLTLRDALTGLLSREAWRQAVAMQLAVRSGNARQCGLLYIDIVAFHDLNSRLGQRAGDDILREMAQRLATLAASVAGVAARLAGDEFAILVPVCADNDTLSRIAQSFGEALARPMQIGAQNMTIQTCIGATRYEAPENGKPLDKDIAGELMTQAELALRWAKQAGRSSYVLYSPAQDDRFHNQTILARSLERAIENNELELHYQPLVDLATGRIVSAEALVRWNHPTLGVQRPDLFIPLAETSGLILPLGRWVLKQALRQHKLWQDAGLAPPRIALNVSGNQLIDPSFVSFVADALTTLQANAKDFEIELTEGLLIEPSPQIVALLHALRNMGFTITIDDFGTGHSTFRYLRDFPVDKLKIDQIFVRKLVLGSTDALIIRAVVSLARSMGIAFVAEGIETEMQRDFLLREGCRIGQGYLFSMPLVAEDFAWMLANDVKLPLRAAVESTAAEKDTAQEPQMGALSR